MSSSILFVPLMHKFLCAPASLRYTEPQSNSGRQVVITQVMLGLNTLYIHSKLSDRSGPGVLICTSDH